MEARGAAERAGRGEDRRRAEGGRAGGFPARSRTAGPAAPSPGAPVLLESRKYGDLPHRVWEQLWCLQEEPELVLWGPRGTVVREADGRVWNGPYAVVIFFPQDRDWNAVALLQPAGPPRFYCNVCLPPVRTAPGVWSYIDLDLDLIVTADLSHDLRDRDEFELNRQRLAYPPDLARRAEEAVADLVASVEGRHGPFAPGVVDAWLARLQDCL